MALYILEDKSLHPFLSKRTSQEISAVKSLNQRRIPTRSITDISDLSVLLSDSESIFLIPYSIGEDTLPAVEFCNLNGIPVIAMHSITRLRSGIYLQFNRQQQLVFIFQNHIEFSEIR